MVHSAQCVRLTDLLQITLQINHKTIKHTIYYALIAKKEKEGQIPRYWRPKVLPKKTKCLNFVT